VPTRRLPFEVVAVSLVGELRHLWVMPLKGGDVDVDPSTEGGWGFDGLWKETK
jgi:hypothetical protein